MIVATPRLLLREFVLEDWAAVLAYQSDPHYLHYYPWTERSEADAQAFVQRFVDWQTEEPRFRFQLALTLCHDGRLVGNCGLRLAEAGAREAVVGYEISPAYWGRGYATEAAWAMLRFGFEELGLHRIWSHAITENIASQRVLQKLGMRYEGRLREKDWYKGRWWDSVIYAILEHEWRAEQA
jgi:ribosomal-protein-alanine N-acetyltransferase